MPPHLVDGPVDLAQAESAPFAAHRGDERLKDAVPHQWIDAGPGIAQADEVISAGWNAQLVDLIILRNLQRAYMHIQCAAGPFVWTNAGPYGVYTAQFFAADKDGISTLEISITVNCALRGKCILPDRAGTVEALSQRKACCHFGPVLKFPHERTFFPGGRPWMILFFLMV
jgi:hypothetical protein